MNFSITVGHKTKVKLWLMAENVTILRGGKALLKGDAASNWDFTGLVDRFHHNLQQIRLRKCTDAFQWWKNPID